MSGMKGDPSTTTTTYPPPIPPPEWDFAKSFWGMIAPSLMGGRQPTYPGSVDPGMSPTMQTGMRLAQGYASSPTPQILGQASGALGGFMNPKMQSVGWGMQSPRQSYFPMPQPQTMPQYPGSANPWYHSAKSYMPQMQPNPYQGAPGAGGGAFAMPQMFQR